MAWLAFTVFIAGISVIVAILNFHSVVNEKSSGSSLPGKGLSFAIIECPGGTDKGEDGHRPDSHYIIESLRSRGSSAEIFTYSDATFQEDAVAISKYADAYISRIDPGEYEVCSEKKYFELLQTLIDHGVMPFNSPNDMTSLGAKRSLMHLAGMYFFPNSTYLYTSRDEFEREFPQRLQYSGHRVLKQNRGSKGDGVWWLSPLPGSNGIADMVVRAVEAVDNHKETLPLSEFTENYLGNYFRGSDDFILDMEFLPRISEGEIRLVLSGKRVIHVVEKIPNGANLSEDSFSANLGAGAAHQWQRPTDWRNLVDPFVAHMDELLHRMGVAIPPVLWTVDFIRYGEPGASTQNFVISEINASCVGFVANPELSEEIAETIISLVFAAQSATVRGNVQEVPQQY